VGIRLFVRKGRPVCQSQELLRLAEARARERGCHSA
jgi:hypothetical protein